MLLLTTLIIVTASSIRPFELKQTVHELLGLLVGSLILGCQLLTCPLTPKLAFNGSIALDSDSLLGLLVLGSSAMVVLLTWLEDMPSPTMVAVLTASSALLLTAQTSSLALVSLELQSYAAYAVVALGSLGTYRQVSASTYLLVGAIATAAFVIGWALLFHVGELALARMPASGHMGQVCQVAAILAKVGCFPFGFWLPVAYGGMEWATLGIVAVLPQISLSGQVWTLAPAGLTAVYLLSGASVAVGSLLSSSTPHVRSLLAFSGMSHVGYLLSGSALTLYPIFLYSLAYTLIFSLFCASLASSSLRPSLRLSSLRGYANLFAMNALAIQVAAFSLGGVPPLLGFFSKSYILLGGICLSSSLIQPLLLIGLGAVGMVAYLRLALATVGYPQTYSYLVQPGITSSSYGGPRALLLASVLISELAAGDLSLALLA